METFTFQPTFSSSIHAQITRPAKESSKPLVLFLHYYGGTSQTWHKLTDRASSTSLSTTHPTIAVDLRGWGQSTGPINDDGNDYSISVMASDVATLLARISEDKSKRVLLKNGFLLVGHSMGAKVALATMGQLHRTLHDLLKGLVLVAPAPLAALDLPPEMKAQQLRAYESEDSVRWTVNNVLANPKNIAQADIDRVICDSLSGNSFAMAAWPSYGMQEDISQAVQEALASWSRLRASVLLGELDIVETRERVEEKVIQFLRQNGVEVSLTVVEGVQHLIPLEDPDSIYKEICRW